jgi:hypothetical protein
MTKRTRPRKPDAYDPDLIHDLKRYMQYPVDSSGQECPDGGWVMVPLVQLEQVVLILEAKPRIRPKSHWQKLADERVIAWARKRKRVLESEGTPRGDATEQAAKEAANRSLLSWPYIKNRMQRRP